MLRTDDDIGHVRRIPAEGATTADDEPIGGPPRKNKAGDRGSACLNGTVTLFPMRIRRIPLPSCATLVCVIVEFMDDDDGYIAWLAEHPNGFVLNCGRPPTPSYLMLHRAMCGTINGTPARGRSWTVIYQKVCANTKRELVDWASEIGVLQPCKLCKPCGEAPSDP